MGTACAANVTAWTTTVTAGTTVVLGSIFTQLQTAINRENTRRGMAADSFTATTTGVVITAAVALEQLKNNINELRTNQTWGQSALSWAQTYTSQIGVSIKGAHVLEMRTNLNDVENDCICNCNYCTCHCNYCSCNCNYWCTCNCNYTYAPYNYKNPQTYTCHGHRSTLPQPLNCSCNCNYCTCNCNYTTSCACNCNYCTCNSNTCNCNCNYTCTCNCNYSAYYNNPAGCHTQCNIHYGTGAGCSCNYACTCNCNYATTQTAPVNSDINLKTNIEYF